MSFGDTKNPYAYTGYSVPAAQAGESERTTFIRRTYSHLAGAVALLIVIETAIFAVVPEQTLVNFVGMISGTGWLVVLGLFIGVNWIADKWARSDTSQPMQYAGLGLCVSAWSVMMVPLLYIAQQIDGSGSIIASAGLVTALMFGGLTAMVFVTRADFSWMGRFLWIAALAAFGYIACGLLFGFGGFGPLFMSIMVGLACAYILYDTSNVLHHYRTDQHVAASLALFASVALLFWYILQLFMSASSD